MKHQHDCETCQYLGEFESNGQVYDLYHHDPDIRTLIARYGPDGEYMSGLCFGIRFQDDPQNPLGEAYRRAKQQGLSVEETYPVK